MSAQFVTRRSARRILAGVCSAAVLSLAACSHVNGGLQASPAPSGVDCTVSKLPLRNPGRFTVATDDPAYPPWFIGDNPNNGQGLESAVIYAVAKNLGFTSDQVDWVQETFNAAIAPGEKSFDVDIDQITITPQRRQNVDFSTPYFDTSQAVVTLEGSKLAGITSIAELRGSKLGAQADSTSLEAINDLVKPEVPADAFNSNEEAVKALESRKIDGLVVDLPTAFQMTSGQIDGGLLVGRLPEASGKLEQFGMVLTQGSKLTPCIDQAIATLRNDGTLADLQGKWINLPDIPELKQ